MGGSLGATGATGSIRFSSFLSSFSFSGAAFKSVLEMFLTTERR
jgi:hypothetical protein